MCGALSGGGGRWSRGWGTLVKGALGSRGGWGVGEIGVGVGEVRVYSRWGSWGGGGVMQGGFIWCYMDIKH